MKKNLLKMANMEYYYKVHLISNQQIETLQDQLKMNSIMDIFKFILFIVQL